MFCLIKSNLLMALITAVYAAREKDLPSYFPRCKLDDKVNECLLKASETVKPFLKKGVPELGIPPIEPYTIPEILLEQGTQALNFKALLKNIEIRGLGNYKFSQLDFHVSDLEWVCKATIDSLTLHGDYNVTGKVLLAPIEGNGKFVASIDNCNVSALQKSEVILKKGVEYLNPVNTTTSIVAGGLKAHLDGLFSGNEDLNKITNTVINDNINELFQDLKPVIETVISNLLEGSLLKAIATKVPYAKLYPTA